MIKRNLRAVGDDGPGGGILRLIVICGGQRAAHPTGVFSEIFAGRAALRLPKISGYPGFEPKAKKENAPKCYFPQVLFVTYGYNAGTGQEKPQVITMW